MDQQSKIEQHILKRYCIIKKIGSGAYGHVWKVEQKETKKIFALKKIFDAFQHSTDAQRTYREIQILKQIDHPNIIKLHQTFKAENNKDVYLIFQYMEADLHFVIAQGILKEIHIRFIIYQLAKALKYLHSGFVIHRDLKPSNILINSTTTIKLCDFGLVRSFANFNSGGTPTLTEGVATRWYRAPEILLGSTCYSTPADIWSFGCIIFEIVTKKPMLPGENIADQIQKIIEYSGYPTEEQIKSVKSNVVKQMLKQTKLQTCISNKNQFLKQIPPIFADLIQKMTNFNPQQRMTLQEILNSEAVQPFRKKQQQIECSKIIKAQINDNKKLSVDEYRTLIYGNGIKKSNSFSCNQFKSSLLDTKKYLSFTKLNYKNQINQKYSAKDKQKDLKIKNKNNFSNNNYCQKGNNKQLKITRDAKDKDKKLYRKLPDCKKQPLQDSLRITYISNNFYSPKYTDTKQYLSVNTLSTSQSQCYNNSSTCTHSHSNSGYVGGGLSSSTNIANSSKLINSVSAGSFAKNKIQLPFAFSSNKSNSKQPVLFKSSKYITNKGDEKKQ